jgi:hypothetical protein
MAQLLFLFFQKTFSVKMAETQVAMVDIECCILTGLAIEQFSFSTPAPFLDLILVIQI